MVLTIIAALIIITAITLIQRHSQTKQLIQSVKAYGREIILTLAVGGTCFAIFMTIVYFDIKQVKQENQSIYNYYSESDIAEIKIGSAHNHYDREVIFSNDEKRYVNLRCDDGCTVIEIE